MKKENYKYLIIPFIVIIIISMSIYKSTTKPKLTGDFFELHVSKDFNKDDYLDKGYPVMFDIGGTGCLACMEMTEELKKTNEILQNKAVIKFIDYWEYPNLADQFKFSITPTQFFYNEDGNLYKVHEGILTSKEILNIFKEMGYNFNE